MTRLLALLFLSLGVLSGCATKLDMRALVPAKVGDAKVKRIMVASFDEEQARVKLNLASRIETNLASYKLDGKNYFTVINRSNLSDVIEEQKIQSVGLVEDAIELGSLVGAQALVTGSVDKSRYFVSYFREDRLKKVCDRKGKNCREVIRPVSCSKINLELVAQVKVIDIETSALVTAIPYSYDKSWTECEDNAESFVSPSSELSKMADSLARDVITHLAPSYTFYSVEVYKKSDIKLTSVLKNKFKNSLSLIEANSLSQAEAILRELDLELNSASYAVAYNLGVVLENQSKYAAARAAYLQADKIAQGSEKLINQAVQRINRRLAQQDSLVKQLELP